MFNYFLECKNNGRSIKVITINGYHINGTIIGVNGNKDFPYVTIKSDGKVKRVFFHAISTVEEL